MPRNSINEKRLPGLRPTRQYTGMNEGTPEDFLPEELPSEDSSPAGDGVGEAVLAANDAFYRALESLEIKRMDDVWVQEDWVTCVHPGWPMLTGWNAVRASWDKIFKNTETIRLEITDVGVRVEGSTAWVTCNENVLHLSSSGIAGAAATSTNVFVKSSNGWKLVLHHASPVPDAESDE